MRTELNLAALSALALALACSEDDSQRSRICGERACSADCEQLRGNNCDILREDCQQRILKAVVCVRGTPGELPEVRTITPEEYRAELLDEDDEDAGIEEQAEDDAWSRGLTLVGLLDPEESAESASIDDRTDNVAGYYSSSTRSITLIDRGRAESSDDAQALLAHELVHALQDQHMGLGPLHDRTGRSTDSSFARSCLVEGEATLYEDLAISLLNGLPVDTAFWDADLAWRLKFYQGEIALAPSPYSRLWRLNYAVGTRFITDAWLRGGNRAVQGIYWAVPQSTIYWMHGYDALARREGQLVRPLACLRASAPLGYETEWRVSLGAFAVYAFLAQIYMDDGIVPIEAAWQDALLWREDNVTIFRNADADRIAVSWRILFDHSERAMRIADRLTQRFDEDIMSLTATARDRELEILAAEDRAILLGEWRGTDPGACPIDED